jgi:hypothetical protein
MLVFRFLTIIFVVLLIQFSFADEGKDKQYGQTLSLDSVTVISDILASPDNYLGKKVLVQGRILDVCKKRGCWMEIAGDKEFESIRVKVDDGVIVFPLSAKGKVSKVEGILEKFELTIEQTIKRLEHHAEEQGEEFDPATVTEGMTVYQLRGLGALINE